jgi:hypothetical protein
MQDQNEVSQSLSQFLKYLCDAQDVLSNMNSSLRRPGASQPSCGPSGRMQGENSPAEISPTVTEELLANWIESLNLLIDAVNSSYEISVEKKENA